MSLPPWLRKLASYKGLIVPVSFVMLLVVILVPLPPWLMDVLISLNVSLGVVVLLTTVYLKHPLDFSVFPSVLLATTLLRLVLNIASTRLILTADASSPEAALGVAGRVISAFGNFVAGESIVVGAIIFLILVIVQFIVVTKGAGRISEVAARFTLDAMPGKQMAIDADVAAGTITEEEARERRETIRREADFFGAMDGASKFVRGDAIAGILITLINVMGGFAIGAFERGWPAGQSADVFTRLSIGDGLTSAIPSFVISIASALIVTRSGSKNDLGTELTGQITSQPVGLYITAAFLGFLAFTPLPTLPLLLTAFVIAGVAWSMKRSAKAEEFQKAAEEQMEQQAPIEPPPVESLLKLDTLELEVGYGLVSLVDKAQGGDLLDRIVATRRQLALELGFVMPPVRIRDNMELEPNTYRLKARGAPLTEGRVEPTRLMAMDPGIATDPIEGLKTVEPAFGLDAWWIEPRLRARAETMNYTVVDPTSVIATHLQEVVKQNASELLTREEVSNLIESLKETAPKLVEETVPAVIKTHELQRILENLLVERVPIRDLESILEVLGEWAPKTRDLDVLTEYARNGLRRTISSQYATPDADGTRTLHCITLDPSFEDTVESFVDRSSGTTQVNMPSRVSRELTERIAETLGPLLAAGHLPVVIASPAVRSVVRRFAAPSIPGLAVLGFNEVIEGVQVESMGLVSAGQAETAGTIGSAA